MTSIGKSNCQKTFHEDSFSMTFYEHSSSLAFTIMCNYGRNKQDKHYHNHQFPLHIPQQSKHNSGEFRYEASKWYIINFQWVFRVQIIGGRGDRIHKYIGNDKYTLTGIQFFFTTIEANEGVSERLVRYLAIEKALQIEMKATPEQNNQ